MIGDYVDQAINDYSWEDRCFGAGMVGFVDTVDDAELQGMTESERTTFTKEKHSVDRHFLEHDRDMQSLSVIVPIKIDGKHVMGECLESIKQQSLIKHHPEKVEVIVVHDGPLLKPNEQKLRDQLTSFPDGTRCRLFQLAQMKGRATARNLGVYHASGEIVAFVDSSMILYETCLAEQMLRHQRAPNIALLGFKENITKDDYEKRGRAGCSGFPRPDYREDWKWRHILKKGEAPFDFRGRTYLPGKEISYMSLTNWLRRLKGSQKIGYRSLPTFFQTNIVSVSLAAVKHVGGVPSIFDDGMWGLEDSALGALLVARGTTLVPCPSAVAFKVDHEEDKTKSFELKRHRELYTQFLERRQFRDHSETVLRQEVQELRRNALFVEVPLRTSPTSASGKRPRRLGSQTSAIREHVPLPVHRIPGKAQLFCDSFQKSWLSKPIDPNVAASMFHRPDDLPPLFYHWRLDHRHAHWVDFHHLLIIRRLTAPELGLPVHLLVTDSWAKSSTKRHKNIEHMAQAVLGKQAVVHWYTEIHAYRSQFELYAREHGLDETAFKLVREQYERDKRLRRFTPERERDSFLVTADWIRYAAWHVHSRNRCIFLCWRYHALTIEELLAHVSDLQSLVIYTPDITIDDALGKFESTAKDVVINPRRFDSILSWLATKPSPRAVTDLVKYLAIDKPAEAASNGEFRRLVSGQKSLETRLRAGDDFARAAEDLIGTLAFWNRSFFRKWEP
jgi:hypothetical protein